MTVSVLLEFFWLPSDFFQMLAGRIGTRRQTTDASTLKMGHLDGPGIYTTNTAAAVGGWSEKP